MFARRVCFFAQDSSHDGKGLFTTEARQPGQPICELWGEFRIFDTQREATEFDPHCVQVLDGPDLKRRLEDGETVAGSSTRLYLFLDKSCPVYYVNSSRRADNKPGPYPANCRLVRTKRQSLNTPTAIAI